MKHKRHNEGEIITKKDYFKKIIFSLEDFSNTGHLLQVVTILPQTKLRAHKHAQQTEVHYVLEGEAVFTFNGQALLAQPGDAFITPPGDIHKVWNKTDKNFKLIVFKINVPSDTDDTEWMEE